jgi:hypothetical protein
MTLNQMIRRRDKYGHRNDTVSICPDGRLKTIAVGQLFGKVAILLLDLDSVAKDRRAAVISRRSPADPDNCVLVCYDN